MNISIINVAQLSFLFSTFTAHSPLERARLDFLISDPKTRTYCDFLRSQLQLFERVRFSTQIRPNLLYSVAIAIIAIFNSMYRYDSPASAHSILDMEKHCFQSDKARPSSFVYLTMLFRHTHAIAIYRGLYFRKHPGECTLSVYLSQTVTFLYFQ